MITKAIVALPACLFGVYLIWITGSVSADSFVPNLSESCYDCLCYVTTKCDVDHTCTDSYCGRFNISRLYWADAGMVVVPNDVPGRDRAWEECAQDYDCAKIVIKNYMEKYGQDCNGDGVTNCFDYMMLHWNGGPKCSEPLSRTAIGREWLQRYQKCIF